MLDDESVIEALKKVSTATITTLLFKEGLRNVWIRAATPIFARQGRRAGRAFTLRFLPIREDLATADLWHAPVSTRAAVEEMPSGCIAVAGAMGETGAGIFGDVLCARMVVRGVAGLVTDGAVRDGNAIGELGLPVWAQRSSAPPAVSALTFVDWQMPVACGGVAIFPGDFIVADDDGAVVIPPAQVLKVASLGPEEEELDLWIKGRVQAGEALPGLYPADEKTLERFRENRQFGRELPRTADQTRPPDTP